MNATGAVKRIISGALLALGVALAGFGLAGRPRPGRARFRAAGCLARLPQRPPTRPMPLVPRAAFAADR